MSDYALKVKDVKKSFRLPTEQSNGIKQAFVNWTKGIKGYKNLEILRGVSFQVKKGEFFGIVGRNGSGKSTLLKIISQIYTPNSGKVTVNGKLVPFIELGVGFNPELTGRENVYLNGALLGFSHEEMDEMYDDIVDFAELHEFMDQKLKNYSSGMQVRLAFSIAIKAQGDILVLDEVLAVGDEAFQRKCNDFFINIKKDKSKTVILVTHDMGSVKKYCDRAILIKDGRIIVDGDKEDVANSYIEENLKIKDSSPKKPGKKREVGLTDTVPEFSITPLSRQVLQRDGVFKFKINYRYEGDIDPYLAFTIHDNTRGGAMYDSGPMKVKRGQYSVTYQIPVSPFNNTDFKVVASLRAGGGKEAGEVEGFTSDANSCLFSVRDKRNSDYALLKDEIVKVEEL